MTAPTWAIDCVDPPAPEPALPRFARHDADASMSAPGTDQSGTVDQAQALRAVGPALSELRDELLGAIADVRRDLADRDQQLADAYSNLSESYAKLSTAAEEERDMARAVVEGLARVARRVGRLERTLGAQPPP
jgi:ABC-type transporter Mla subunit MlaD